MKFDIPPPPYECVVINIDDTEIVGVHTSAKSKSSASIVNKQNDSKPECSETEVLPPSYEDISMHI